MINEFLWESSTPNGLIEKFRRDFRTDVMLCTHTGIKWHRRMGEGLHLVNVGVIGRPENDGQTNVWYTILTRGRDLQVEFVPVHYDYERLARHMEQEGYRRSSSKPFGPAGGRRAWKSSPPRSGLGGNIDRAQCNPLGNTP